MLASLRIAQMRGACGGFADVVGRRPAYHVGTVGIVAFVGSPVAIVAACLDVASPSVHPSMLVDGIVVAGVG